VLSLQQFVCAHRETFDNSNAKDDFAELRAGFEIGVGSGSFSERENAVEDGLEASRGHQAHDAVDLGLRAHVGAE
jgi:hypothetical protein